MDIHLRKLSIYADKSFISAFVSEKSGMRPCSAVIDARRDCIEVPGLAAMSMKLGTLSALASAGVRSTVWQLAHQRLAIFEPLSTSWAAAICGMITIATAIHRFIAHASGRQP